MLRVPESSGCSVLIFAVFAALGVGFACFLCGFEGGGCFGGDVVRSRSGLRLCTFDSEAGGGPRLACDTIMCVRVWIVTETGSIEDVAWVVGGWSGKERD